MQHRPDERTAAAGLTLLETLVVMALIGVLVSLAAPALSALHQQHKLQAQAEDLLGSLVLARSEALRRQQRVTMCVRASDSACAIDPRWQQGWMVFVDANDNAWLDPGESLIELHPPLPTSFRTAVTSTDPDYFSYNAEGRSATRQGAFMAATWRFCRTASDTGWQVVVNALGRPRLEKMAASDCAAVLSGLGPPGS